jgi:hypothetical protein
MVPARSKASAVTRKKLIIADPGHNRPWRLHSHCHYGLKADLDLINRSNYLQWNVSLRNEEKRKRVGGVIKCVTFLNFIVEW